MNPSHGTICGFSVNQIKDEVIPFSTEEAIMNHLAKLHSIRMNNPEYKLSPMMGGYKVQECLKAVKSLQSRISEPAKTKLVVVARQVNEYVDKVESCLGEYRLGSMEANKIDADLNTLYTVLTDLTEDVEAYTGRIVYPALKACG